MSTNQESVHTTEVNITVTSEQLADDSYVKKLLVTTKMNVLAEIAACNDTSMSDIVKEYCPEVYNYSDLLEKYSITQDESTKKKKPKLLAKKKKAMVKKVDSEPSKLTSSPKPSTPVVAASEPSSPKPLTPVVAASEPSSPLDESKSTPTEAPKAKKPKKKLVKKKPKPKSSED